MANNNKHTGPNVPALRFPEFSGEWECVPLSTYAKKITEKNKGNKIKNVLCNSATRGIVPQSEYFDREIANNENTDGYYVVRNQDFVYNPRKSVSAPYGPVNIYNGEDDGIISPLYLCMKIRGIDKNYLLHYFKSPAWYPYIYQNGDSGVRHDRVSIKDEVFLAMPVSVPNGDEQRKIAKFLDAINERIATQTKIIEELTTLRSALHQGIMSKGLEDGSWRIQTLADVLSERTELNIDGHAVHSVSVSKGIVNQIEYLGRSFAAKDTSRYHVAYPGDVIYTKSPTGEFPYGIVKQSQISIKAALSPLYGVYVPISPEIGYIIHNHFLSAKNALNYLHPLIQKGAKNTINITNQRFLQNSMPLPINKNAALLYYNAIKTVSDKIILEEMVMEKFQSQKSFLLKTMFI